jgi:hypothetical protein
MSSRRRQTSLNEHLVKGVAQGAGVLILRCLHRGRFRENESFGLSVLGSERRSYTTFECR